MNEVQSRVAKSRNIIAQKEAEANSIAKNEMIVLEKVRLGLLGQLFGDPQNAPNNIAAFSILISTAMIVLMVYFPTSITDIPRNELLTLFGSVITLALGYIFGQKKGSD